MNFVYLIKLFNRNSKKRNVLENNWKVRYKNYSFFQIQNNFSMINNNSFCATFIFIFLSLSRSVCVCVLDLYLENKYNSLEFFSSYLSMSFFLGKQQMISVNKLTCLSNIYMTYLLNIVLCFFL